MKLSLYSLAEKLEGLYPNLCINDWRRSVFDAIKILEPICKNNCENDYDFAEFEINPNTLYVDIYDVYSQYAKYYGQVFSVVLFGQNNGDLEPSGTSEKNKTDASEPASNKNKTYDVDNINQPQQSILVMQDVDRIAFFNDALNILELSNSWESKTLKAVADGEPLNDILDMCSMIDPNTVYVTDPNLKMISRSSSTIMDEASAVWKYQNEHGYMPMTIIRELVDSGEFEYMNSRKKAFTYPDTCFNNPYTCQNIFDDGKLMAHIFIINLFPNTTNIDLDVAQSLEEPIKTYLKTKLKETVSFGTFYESFFRDILNKDLVDKQDIELQLEIFDWKFSSEYCIIVIDLDYSEHIQRSFFAHLLESQVKLDCKVFAHDGFLVAICHKPPTNIVIYELLMRMYDSIPFYAAISNTFNEISNMSIYYSQACKILNFGRKYRHFDSNNAKNKYLSHIFLFSTYGIYITIEELLQNHSLCEVCHQGVLAILSDDKQDTSRLLTTLYCYLTNDRNVRKCAQALFVHRNTLLRRIEKINTLLGVDINNCTDDEKHHILFSTMIAMHYSNRL